MRALWGREATRCVSFGVDLARRQVLENSIPVGECRICGGLFYGQRHIWSAATCRRFGSF